MLISNLSLSIIAYILIVYVLCGIIKGSIGFGMPTVSISLLSFVLDIKIIIALILIPTLIVNMYQLSRGGNFKKILNETKYFLVFSAIFIFPGAYLLKILDSSLIIFFIALILILNSVLYLLRMNIKLPYYDKTTTQILVGSVNGVIIGMTSIYTMPLVFLLQALNYNKNTTIQFLGIAFFLYPLGQLISFANFDLLSKEIIIYSVIILIPIFIGLIIGQKIRQKIPEALFQKFFYIMLLFMGTIILINLI